MGQEMQVASRSWKRRGNRLSPGASRNEILLSPRLQCSEIPVGFLTSRILLLHPCTSESLGLQELTMAAVANADSWKRSYQKQTSGG